MTGTGGRFVKFPKKRSRPWLHCMNFQCIVESEYKFFFGDLQTVAVHSFYFDHYGHIRLNMLNGRTVTTCKSPKIFFLFLTSLYKFRTNQLVWGRINVFFWNFPNCYIGHYSKIKTSQRINQNINCINNTLIIH
jgi:hypothetical protein